MDIIKRSYRDKTYSYALLRQSFRDQGRVRHRTLANLSALPPELIELIRSALKGEQLVPAQTVFEIERSFPHGHLAAVLGTMRSLKIRELLSIGGFDQRDERLRSLTLAMIAAKVIEPASKLATVGFLERTALPQELGVAGKIDQDDLYEAMDWLLELQEIIERRLAQRHLHPGGLCLYDRSSAVYTGRRCELAERGYSRDGIPNSLQVTFGLTCCPQGRPLAIKVDRGSLSDPQTVGEELDLLRRRFKLREVVLVTDRGILTQTRIDELKKIEGVGWISALRLPSIRRLVREGSLQLSLFDVRDLAEISSEMYPGERLIVCYNPMVAEDRKRTRESLLTATEQELEKVARMVACGRLKEEGKIGERVGRVINRFKVAKLVDWQLQEQEGGQRLSHRRRHQAIEDEGRLDGFYVIRTSLASEQMEPAQVVRSYKSLSRVEAEFRVIKGPDLEVAPIRHRLTERIAAHFLICQLAAYVRWQMERDLAPLLYRDEQPSPSENPVGPALRSAPAERKARQHRTADGLTAHSFRGLLRELATLTKSVVVLNATGTRFYKLSQATPLQERAFQLLGLKLPVAKTPPSPTP